ncbi:hypothetical protein GCM10011577_02290 [Pseudarthrobacter polychromogenes]|uniref:Uncharacterized protein n=1 Tax=Pseudarthrobacter polychromogenes TaxID=1676 RepID=A0ABQ1X9F4_9MICC|nr:hypothetical protein GCM10011577_02290 [Pseudarthrobacter polychromogenes]
MESTRGVSRYSRTGAADAETAAGPGAGAGVPWMVAVGIAKVEDKRHPFAGASRTGSTGLDLSRLSARHPVSVPQPSFFAVHSVKVTQCDRSGVERGCSIALRNAP